MSVLNQIYSNAESAEKHLESIATTVTKLYAVDIEQAKIEDQKRKDEARTEKRIAQEKKRAAVEAFRKQDTGLTAQAEKQEGQGILGMIGGALGSILGGLGGLLTTALSSLGLGGLIAGAMTVAGPLIAGALAAAIAAFAWTQRDKIGNFLHRNVTDRGNNFFRENLTRPMQGLFGRAKSSDLRGEMEGAKAGLFFNSGPLAKVPEGEDAETFKQQNADDHKRLFRVQNDLARFEDLHEDIEHEKSKPSWDPAYVEKAEAELAKIAKDITKEYEFLLKIGIDIKGREKREHTRYVYEDWQGKQRGGSIRKVPGHSTGDKHFAWQQPGDIVVNRNAAGLMFKTGGAVPTMVESGELLIPGNHPSAGMGLLMNSLIPRFASGGYVGTTNVVDTGDKDSAGRPIKFSPSAAKAWKKMKADGMTVVPSDVTSAWRGPDDYNRILRNHNAGVPGYGKPAANSFHNHGEAIDVHGNTGAWIRANGHKYGWGPNDYKGTHGGHYEYKGPGSKGVHDSPSEARGEDPVTPGAQLEANVMGGSNWFFDLFNFAGADRGTADSPANFGGMLANMGHIMTGVIGGAFGHLGLELGGLFGLGSGSGFESKWDPGGMFASPARASKF